MTTSYKKYNESLEKRIVDKWGATYSSSNSFTGNNESKSSNKDVDQEKLSGAEKNKGGGGGNMGDLIERVNQLEIVTKKMKKQIKKTAQKSDIEALNASIVTLTNLVDTKLGSIPSEDRIKIIVSDELKSVKTKLDSLPDEDKIKVVISDQVKHLNIPNESFVEAKITASRNTMILWIVATAIAAGSLLFAALRHFAS